MQNQFELIEEQTFPLHYSSQSKGAHGVATSEEEKTRLIPAPLTLLLSLQSGTRGPARTLPLQVSSLMTRVPHSHLSGLCVFPDQIKPSGKS